MTQSTHQRLLLVTFVLLALFHQGHSHMEIRYHCPTVTAIFKFTATQEHVKELNAEPLCSTSTVSSPRTPHCQVPGVYEQVTSVILVGKV